MIKLGRTENREDKIMENQKKLFMDVHVLQNLPPSCVNRDDTGSPKTAIYGGEKRARVSSQSWKHAMRKEFEQILSSGDRALRTKKIVILLADQIRLAKPEMTQEESEAAATQLFNNCGLKIKSTEKGNDALFFISMAQVDNLVKIYAGDQKYAGEKLSKEQKSDILQALNSKPGIEIAMFGRMVADNPLLNTDACAQVAHAISTHRVSNEFDYFTAVDDMQSGDNAGAGHLGTVEYNSSTVYRYTTVALHELFKNLGDDTPQAAIKFLTAFVKSMPTGKQNTFANRTLPDLIWLTLRTDQPVNLVGAFEKPVKQSDTGYVIPSINALEDYAKDIESDYGIAPVYSGVVGSKGKDVFDNVLSFDQLLKEAESEIVEYIGNINDNQNTGV